MLVLLLLINVILISGCIELKEQLSQHTASEQGQTINEFFDKNIVKYTERIVSERIECISGECPESEPELKTVEKDCYFCDISKIKGNRLELIHDKGQSRSQDASFGCIKNYDGPVMEGFEIIEQNDEILKVRGDIKFYYSQKSTHCDREKDPECDDATYGNCAGEDYSQVSVRTVEMIFKP